jgi:hypothetical protein
MKLLSLPNVSVGSPVSCLPASFGLFRQAGIPAYPPKNGGRKKREISGNDILFSFVKHLDDGF